MRHNTPGILDHLLCARGHGLSHLVENGSVTFEQADDGDVYYNGGTIATMPLQTEAAAIELISNSGDDDVDGTGALTVRVEGLDANYAWVYEDFIMTGAVAVVGTVEFLRVQHMVVLTAGTGGTNAGAIDAQAVAGGQVWDEIVADEGMNQHSLITVPAGKTFWVTQWIVSSNALVATTVRLMHRSYGGAWQVHGKRHSYLGGAIEERMQMAMAMPFAEKTDLKFSVTVGGACSISSHMRGFLTDDTPSQVGQY